jgi:serine/threonine protein kinase HipA of HipAB toxin-antitoxin module
VIEDNLRALLLTFGAVTALVAQRIRPDELHQSDALPAIVLSVPSEEHHNDLEATGGLVAATVLITAIAETKLAARAIAEAVRTNGTNPGTGLAGYSGAAGSGSIQGAFLLKTSQHFEPEQDGSADSRWEITGEYEVWYAETV